MREPADELRLKSKALRFGVRNAGKVLEADEGNTSLSTISSRAFAAHTYHERDVDVEIVLEQCTAMLDVNRASKMISSILTLAEGSDGQRRSEPLSGVRTIRSNVAVPVRLEKLRFEGAMVAATRSVIEHSEETAGSSTSSLSARKRRESSA